MDKFIVRGGNALRGDINVQGSKNALLPILAATLLTDEDVILTNCALIKDADNMLGILEILGATATRYGNTIRISTKNANSYTMPDKQSREMRSSIFMLGPVLSRFGKVCCVYPGGCAIGNRPINLHLSGLSDLGVTVTEADGKIMCDSEFAHAADISLDFPSVGATENLMMASVNLDGTTTINNAAREPEIVDLQNFMCALGYDVSGAGTSLITVRGGKRYVKGPIEYDIMPDRIVAGTLLCAAAATRSEITLRRARAYDMTSVLAKLREMACKVNVHDDIIHIDARAELKALQNTETQPHPGFPTDMQAQLFAVCTTLDGTSVIRENLYENRFRHASELKKMGANVTLHDRTAVIRGGKLHGSTVSASDLRGGAALVIAGLAASGTTVIEDVDIYIDRGYESMEVMLEKIGADIKRIKD